MIQTAIMRFNRNASLTLKFVSDLYDTYIMKNEFLNYLPDAKSSKLAEQHITTQRNFRN